MPPLRLQPQEVLLGKAFAFPRQQEQTVAMDALGPLRVDPETAEEIESLDELDQIARDRRVRRQPQPGQMAHAPVPGFKESNWSSRSRCCVVRSRVSSRWTVARPPLAD